MAPNTSSIKKEHRMGAPSEATRLKLITAFTTPLPASACKAEDDCTICLEALCAGAETAHEPAIKPKICGHSVHTSCLLTWTAKNSSCPYCRQEIFVAPKQNRAYQRNSIRKFAVPFESGDYVISESLYSQWENSVTSKEEFAMVMEFREFWDEGAVDDYLKF